MKRIVVDVDDELHKRIKVNVAYEDSSIKNYIIKLIEKDLKKGE